MRLSATEVADGRFLGVQRGPDGFVYYLEVSTLTGTWTNLCNGKSRVEQVKGLVGEDQTITDSGDGALTISNLSPSRVAVYGPGGQLTYRAAGVATYRFLIDDNRTPQDPTDDSFLAYLGVLSRHGLDDTAGLCEEVAAALRVSQRRPQHSNSIRGTKRYVHKR